MGRDWVHIREYVHDILRMDRGKCREKLAEMNMCNWQSLSKFGNALIIGISCCLEDRRRRMTLVQARDKLADLIIKRR